VLRVSIPIFLFGIVAAAGHRSHNRVAFGDITVDEGEEVRSVVALGGSVSLLDGSHAHEVVALGGSVDLGKGAQVDRDVVAIGGDISVGAGAHIGRDAVTYGGAVEVEEGGSVSGTISPHPGYDFGSKSSDQDEGEKELSPAAEAAWTVSWGVFELLCLVAFGSLMLSVLPRQLDAVVESLARHPWSCALTGLFGLILLAPLTVMLILTLIGILFIPILYVGVFFAGAVGYTAVALFIGRHLPIRVGDYGRLALGAVVVTLLNMVPIVGTVAWWLGWLLAFGAVLRTRFGTRMAAGPDGRPPAAVPAAS
jgi:hypothetical protein